MIRMVLCCTADFSPEISIISRAASSYSKRCYKWKVCIFKYLLPSLLHTRKQIPWTGSLRGHIKCSQMPARLRGREVHNSTVDVWISNNGPFRQLCSLIPPHWPLAWISLIQTIHTQSCTEGQPPSLQLSSLVDMMTPLTHKNDSLIPPSRIIFHLGEDWIGSVGFCPF